MNFDVITVGGGLGGAALARSLALQGVRVLVLERERTATSPPRSGCNSSAYDFQQWKKEQRLFQRKQQKR